MRARALRTECENANYFDLSQLSSITMAIIYMRQGIFLPYCRLLCSLGALTRLISHESIHMSRV